MLSIYDTTNDVTFLWKLNFDPKWLEGFIRYFFNDSIFQGIINTIHLFLTPSLNGLFKETSSGCKIEVNPPGITAKFVFSRVSAVFTLSVTWASNALQTSRLLLLTIVPFLCDPFEEINLKFWPCSFFATICSFQPRHLFQVSLLFRHKRTLLSDTPNSLSAAQFPCCSAKLMIRNLSDTV